MARVVHQRAARLVCNRIQRAGGAGVTRAALTKYVSSWRLPAKRLNVIVSTLLEEGRIKSGFSPKGARVYWQAREEVGRLERKALLAEINRLEEEWHQAVSDSYRDAIKRQANVLLDELQARFKRR